MKRLPSGSFLRLVFFSELTRWSRARDRWLVGNLGFLAYTSLTEKSPGPLIEIRNTTFSIVSLAQITFGDADKILYQRLHCSLPS